MCRLNNFWEFSGWPAKLCWQHWWRPSWGTQYTSRPPRSRLFLRNHHRAVEDKPIKHVCLGMQTLIKFSPTASWAKFDIVGDQYLALYDIYVWQSIFCTNGTYMRIHIWHIWQSIFGRYDMSYMGRSIFGNFDQILTINIFFLSKTGRREKQQKQRCAHLEFNDDLQWWWWWWW